jgi:hypothetical protein
MFVCAVSDLLSCWLCCLVPIWPTVRHIALRFRIHGVFGSGWLRRKGLRQRSRLLLWARQLLRVLLSNHAGGRRQRAAVRSRCSDAEVELRQQRGRRAPNGGVHRRGAQGGEVCTGEALRGRCDRVQKLCCGRLLPPAE